MLVLLRYYELLHSTYIVTVCNIELVGLFLLCPNGVAQGTSHPPQDQKTWVHIPTGYRNVFMEIIAMLLCICT
jgi:hypothetical protein